MPDNNRRRSRKLISGRLRRDGSQRCSEAAQIGDDPLFDSFSESQEGSAHGVHGKQPTEGHSRALFHLLTEAAEALYEKGRLVEAYLYSPPAVKHSGEPSKDSDASHSSGRAKQTPEPSSEGCPEAPKLKHSGENGLAATSQLPSKAASEQIVKVDEGPRETSSLQGLQTMPRGDVSASRAPSANCAAPEDIPADEQYMKPPRDQSESHRATSTANPVAKPGERPGWDSIQEASAAGSTAILELPSEMSQQQGSWANASSVSSPRSSTLPYIAGGEVQTDDSDVPHEAFYETCGFSGRRPSARWGHAAAALRDRLVVFGGTGRTCLVDCFVYHAGRDSWSQIFSGKEGPSPTHGAAACSSHNRIFMFGGKQGYKHCRHLYTLDLGTLEWVGHKDSANAPPACSAHSMTTVGRHGIYVFGGEGRKLSNSVYALDPETLLWSKVNTLGAVPLARQSHTAVWDGSDSLLVYGGTNGGRLFGDVRVLSLSTGFWSEARCRGEIPPPRHSHTAAMPAANLMLVWGGCGDRGAVLNDAYLLNTTSFMWHKLKSIGSSPLGRYCHSCHVVGSRILLFGGTNAQVHFDSLISVSLDFGRQLGSLADSLHGFSKPSGGKGSSLELLRMQLGNHLRQRHAQDVSQVAVTRAEIAERLFEQERQRHLQLAAELRHTTLLMKEEESCRKRELQQHAQAVALLQRDKDMEAHRCRELQSRLNAALATIQRQNGEAVVVDGYKAMYDRLALERSRLVERAVELEYENKRLCARAAELEAEAAEARQRLHSVSQVADPWENEFDKREALLGKK